MATIELTLQSRDLGLSLDTRNASLSNIKTLLEVTDIWRIPLVYSYTSPSSLREVNTYIVKTVGLTLRSR